MDASVTIPPVANSRPKNAQTCLGTTIVYDQVIGNGDRGHCTASNIAVQKGGLGALQAKGIKPRIPGPRFRNAAVEQDKRRYRCHNRVEIMYGLLNDWRGATARSDRYPIVFLSAITLAAAVLSWL